MRAIFGRPGPAVRGRPPLGLSFFGRHSIAGSSGRTPPAPLNGTTMRGRPDLRASCTTALRNSGHDANRPAVRVCTASRCGRPSEPGTLPVRAGGGGHGHVHRVHDRKRGAMTADGRTRGERRGLQLRPAFPPTDNCNPEPLAFSACAPSPRYRHTHRSWSTTVCGRRSDAQAGSCDVTEQTSEPRITGTAALPFEAREAREMPRTGWRYDGVPMAATETVADHSHSTAVIGLVLAAMEGANPERTTMLCVLHDLPETRTGDQTPVTRRYITPADPCTVAADQVAAAHPDVQCVVLCASRVRGRRHPRGQVRPRRGQARLLPARPAHAVPRAPGGRQDPALPRGAEDRFRVQPGGSRRDHAPGEVAARPAPRPGLPPSPPAPPAAIMNTMNTRTAPTPYLRPGMRRLTDAHRTAPPLPPLGTQPPERA